MVAFEWMVPKYRGPHNISYYSWNVTLGAEKQNPRFGHLFDQGMGNDATIVANVITRDCRQVFEGFDSVVDVGGGTGTLVKAIAVAHPEIHCTVLDLAPVVAELEGTRNLKYMEGDMFHYVPSSDVVLLKLEEKKERKRMGKTLYQCWL
ncbi:UNVERIFIED_CONTAM: putative O-methyltransferase 3 [Sesamum radiatum]|uniref:O-methyltransferase 3 n=1 Tax=Sesamum radiatum TaxID=300843 RepID=A0AAW2S6L4_SESRA